MTRARRSLRPSLESLEARDTPAGTVAATFAGGRLTLTGDAAGNVLLLTQGPDDRLTISGNKSGTQFQLNGGPALGTITLPTRVTGGVAINLGDGADELMIDGVKLPGALVINGGNGAGDGPAGNTVRLNGVHIGGSLGITNLAGADATYLTGTVDVDGGLVIRNGTGGSTVLGDETTALTVGGAFSVVNGSGFDKVDLWQALGVAVRSLAFRSGSDGDGSYYRVHPAGDLTVAGGVRVINGAGEDRIQLGAGENVAIRGAVVIQNGDGGSFNNMIAGTDLSIGQVAITNGAGDDYNDIHTYETASIRGNVRFVNGSGEGHNYVGDGNLFTIGGNVAFINGAGRDLNTVFSGELRINGTVIARNGDGDSDTSVAAETRLVVGGPTRITSGAGKDLVYIGAGRVEWDTTPVVDVGRVLVNLGNGGSDTQIRGTQLTVRGHLDVIAWDGVDNVFVGTDGDSGSVAGDVFIDIGPGDQQSVLVGAEVGRVLTVGGALGIWTDDTAGPSSISLWGVDVWSWTEIWTGSGADEIGFTGSTFRGAFDLETWSGDDKVYLEWNGAATSFRGPLWVATGDGNDWVLVGGDEETPGQAVFAGATHWNGGAGPLDALVVRFTGGVFLGPDPIVTGFEAAF
ncbi:MAG TPA: hypothetical protein VKD90_07105 [Gemmataceae bacterium]|nr:hypothetical protein [Gemmataceae bacterium]